MSIFSAFAGASLSPFDIEKGFHWILWTTNRKTENATRPTTVATGNLKIAKPTVAVPTENTARMHPPIGNPNPVPTPARAVPSSAETPFGSF